MKKTALFLLMVILTVNLLGVSVYATAVEKKFYNFNDYNTTYNPTGFNLVGGGTAPQNVALLKGPQTAIYGNSTKSFKIEVDASNCDPVPFSANYNPYVQFRDTDTAVSISKGEKVYVTFKIATEDMNFDDITLYSRIKSGTTTSGNFFKIDKNGKFYHSNTGTTANTEITGVKFEPKRWYTVELVVNIVNDDNKSSLLDVYIDGNKVASNKTIQSTVAFDQINIMRISANTKNGTKFYLDDIGYQIYGEDETVATIGKAEIISSETDVTVDNNEQVISCLEGTTYEKLNLSGGKVSYYTDKYCTEEAAAASEVDFENAVAVVETAGGALLYYTFEKKIPEPTCTKYEFENYGGTWNPASNLQIAGSMPSGMKINKLRADSVFGNSTRAVAFEFTNEDGQNPYPLDKAYNPYFDCTDKISLNSENDNGFYYSLKLAVSRDASTFTNNERISLIFRNNNLASGGNFVEMLRFDNTGMKILNSSGTTASNPADKNIMLKANRWYNIEVTFTFTDTESAHMNIYVDGVNVAENKGVKQSHLLGNGGVSTLRTSVLAETPITTYIDDIKYDVLNAKSNTTLLKASKLVSGNNAAVFSGVNKIIACTPGLTYSSLELSGESIDIYTDNTFVHKVIESSEVDFGNALAVVTTEEGAIYTYEFVSNAPSSAEFYVGSVDEANLVSGNTIDNNDEFEIIGTQIISNLSAESIKVMPVLALYKGTKLVKYVFGESKNLAPGEQTELETQINVPQKDEGDTYNIKYFVIDGFDTLRPYGISVSLINSYSQI